MAFTQAQFDAITDAIASGAKSVYYGDKRVDYNSLEEMIRVRNLMAAELGLTSCKSENKKAFYSSGFKHGRIYPE